MRLPFVEQVITLFSHQAKVSSLVPVGFLTARFLQKLWFMKPLFGWGERVVFLLIAFRQDRKCGEKIGKIKNGFFHIIYFLHTHNPEILNLGFVVPSEPRLHKLHFLQKLCCQKPCWDHARLSNLVNKQVAYSCDFHNYRDCAYFITLPTPTF